MKKPYITNIQKYSIHDGTGIRTTIFFKGCPLSCKWCHNPETQKYEPQMLVYTDRCVGCGACAAVCPEHAAVMQMDENGNMKVKQDPTRCVGCGACEEECLYEARELCGKTMELKDLVKEAWKDQAFYETSGGGVTLSGGEILAQDMEYVSQLAAQLFRRGVRVNIDTCGAVPYEAFEKVLPYTDVFLYDIKLFDEELHKQYTGKSNQRILENVKKLSDAGAKLWIRIPVIGGVNDREDEIRRIGEFLAENQILYEKICLLPYHATGSGKYGHLGAVYEGDAYYVPNQEKLAKLKEVLEQTGAGIVEID